MVDVLENKEIIEANGTVQNSISSRTMANDFSMNTSERKAIYYIDENLENEMRKYRYMRIMQMVNEINTLINHDEYIDGEMSQAELFMKEIYSNNQIDYAIEALMQIYSNNLLNVHVLEGILVMISCLPYEAVEPKGQIMAMGLLSNKELIIRDRAIQCFERWNSKKGLNTLKSLNCQPIWLQKYVNKVIMYIERDGEE